MSVSGSQIHRLCGADLAQTALFYSTLSTKYLVPKLSFVAFKLHIDCRQHTLQQRVLHSLNFSLWFNLKQCIYCKVVVKKV